MTGQVIMHNWAVEQHNKYAYSVKQTILTVTQI